MTQKTGSEWGGKDTSSENISMANILENLRKRLLDLTARNRLLNFKHDVRVKGRYLQFVNTSPEAVFDRLYRGNASPSFIKPVEEPREADWIVKNGRKEKPSAQVYAESLGYDTHYELPWHSAGLPLAEDSGGYLQTVYYARELGTYCRQLQRDAKSAIEETGANQLYLICGFLEYPDQPGSEKLYRAPLVCLPVGMGNGKNNRASSFSITYTGEDVTDNLTLREKLREAHGILLPEFQEGSSLTAYFKAVEDVLDSRPGWRLRRMMTLTLLSFSRMFLFRDLDPRNWQKGEGENLLLDHSIVKSVLEGQGEEETGLESNGHAKDYPIDEEDRRSRLHLPLVYDADSSQHSALIDVLDGKNLVIEGPPGTGKSQTITNLIAAALDEGKKILFISEKLAALEVVKGRLERAHLDEFILELHSDNANTKSVLDGIRKRKERGVRKARDIESMIDSLDKKRTILKKYEFILNSIQKNRQGMTVHELFWAVERFRIALEDRTDCLCRLKVPAASEMTKFQREEACTLLKHASEAFEHIEGYSEINPFWGFWPKVLSPGWETAIGTLLEDFAGRFESFSHAISRFLEFFGIPSLFLPQKQARALVETLETLALPDEKKIAFDILPRLFPATSPRGEEADIIINDIKHRINKIKDLEYFLKGRWSSPEEASEEHCKYSDSFYDNMNFFNVRDILFCYLPACMTSWQDALDVAVQACATIRHLSEKIRVNIGESGNVLTCMRALMALASSAPIDLLRFRHEGLNDPYALDVFIEARDKLDHIKRCRAALDARLYLDILPDKAVLEEALLVLREGGSWYRSLQGRWRKAVSVHKRLQREKTKVSPEERIADLAELLDVIKLSDKWKENKTLQKYADVFYQGEDTPLDSLCHLCEWLKKSTNIMRSLHVDHSLFNPLSASPNYITELQEVQPEFETACCGIHSLQEKIRKEGCGYLLISDSSSLDNLNIVFKDIQERIKDIDTYFALLSPLVVQDVVLCGQVPDVVKASRDKIKLEKELDDYKPGKELCASYYKGYKTDLSMIEDTREYGGYIRGKTLPEAIKRKLLSEDSQANRLYLIRMLEDIQTGWNDIAAFEGAMGRYGYFDGNVWAVGVGDNLGEYVAKLHGKTQNALENLRDVLPWSRYLFERDKVCQANMEPFIELMEKGQIPASRLVDAFSYCFYRTISEELFESFPELQTFSGLRHKAIRDEFSALDKEIIGLRGEYIAVHCIEEARPPRGQSGARVSDKTEMCLLDHLVSVSRSRTPIRQIMKRAGRAVQALKPCFMMGPQAVAKFLEPGELEFDIVIMDEASQLRPEAALGAIARGKQLVVVGDPKQLPPTSFFEKQRQTDEGDEEETVAENAESILDICKGHFQTMRTLRWHYRSQHQSLIAFSNHYFYHGHLFVFPSPYSKSGKLGLHYIAVPDSVYEHQQNKVEAQRVIKAIEEHIHERPDDSLGVVTLNTKQRDLIEELWDQRRRDVPDAETFEQNWAEKGEGLFVKNLENVQGDERDCILISTTFGRKANTNVVRQNFGPVSNEGGWRRLNVLFTRARKYIGLITSLRPEDLVPKESSKDGPKVLRNYLEYARNGYLPEDRETGLEPDSDFEVAVIDLLEEHGYAVTPQYGVAGFRIDIAVRHPDYPSLYMAAIECDGASYHSGISVRDRDRIRQEILESVGWKGKIWRIWSTDWFRAPQDEAKKLFSFLEDLRRQPVSPEFVKESKESKESKNNAKDEAPLEPELPFGAGYSAPKQEEGVEELIPGDERDNDEDWVVEEGDIVEYVSVDNENAEPWTVQLVHGPGDPSEGQLSLNTPLAQVFLGAGKGDVVTLRVPGRHTKIFRLLNIKRVM